jgi:hypothetical protein
LLASDRAKLVPAFYSIVFSGAALVMPAIALARALLNLRSEYYISFGDGAYVNGAWLTLASDFSHGILYRPLFGPLGYGGTRFFPLYFVLTGFISKFRLSLETSGLLLSIISVILLATGCYFLLRRLDVPFVLGIAALAAVFVAGTTLEALLKTKGDGLAAMLNLWGLALCISPKPKRELLFLPATFFTLAFAAKLTTVFGFLAVFLYWLFSQRRREAWRLALWTVCGYGLVLCAIYWESGGRAFEIFRECVVSGATLTSVLYGPFKLAGVAYEADPVMLFFFIPCAAMAIAYVREPAIRLLATYFALVFLVTSVIFGTQGTFVNHLIDLHIAAVLLLTLLVSSFPEIRDVGKGIMALSLLVGSVPRMHDLRKDLGRASHAETSRRILKLVPEDGRPLLSQNPLWALKSGQRPYLMDAFMFRVITGKRPALGKDMWDMIKRRGFSGIILDADPTSEFGKRWYGEMEMGGEFLEDLDANYSFRANPEGLYVYLPRQGPEASSRKISARPGFDAR